jgi:hypothetical protein
LNHALIGGIDDAAFDKDCSFGSENFFAGEYVSNEEERFIEQNS